MRTIEQFQIRKIYAIGNALGIKASGSEDELHALVGGVTGKDSIKSLTYREACAVIALSLIHIYSDKRAVKERDDFKEFLKAI